MGLGSEVRPVVQDEGDVADLDQRPERIDRAADLIVRDVLQPQLDTGDIAGIQRGFQNRRERRRIDGRRRDQIKTAGVYQAAPL